MATDMTVMLENRPGTLAEMADALGRAGVNIEGGCGFPSEGRGLIHVLVEDVDAARRALNDAGIAVQQERPVLVMPIPDRPGEFAQVARRLADAGVNIDLMYLATNTRLVIGVDDLERARAVV